VKMIFGKLYARGWLLVSDVSDQYYLDVLNPSGLTLLTSLTWLL